MQRSRIRRDETTSKHFEILPLLPLSNLLLEARDFGLFDEHVVVDECGAHHRSKERVIAQRVGGLAQGFRQEHAASPAASRRATRALMLATVILRERPSLKLSSAGCQQLVSPCVAACEHLPGHLRLDDKRLRFVFFATAIQHLLAPRRG